MAGMLENFLGELQRSILGHRRNVEEIDRKKREEEERRQGGMDDLSKRREQLQKDKARLAQRLDSLGEKKTEIFRRA